MPHWQFMRIFGGIEAGGTKFVCGVGTGPEDVVSVRIPTTAPEETVAAAVAWLREKAGDGLGAVGIGSFGPVDLGSGHITSTPKVGWRGYDLAGAIARALGVEVRFETDVNAAVIGEARWGAGRGVANCLYLTVGTGIGGGAIAGGQVIHGLTHPEMGHIRIPHDRTEDPYAGGCPYHGDCLEGLASGPAIRARWGAAGEELAADHPAWALEAKYLAYGLANFVCTLSPERIVMGGGVMRRVELYEMVRRELAQMMGGYGGKLPEIVPPGLGELSGVLGAIALAKGDA